MNIIKTSLKSFLFNLLGAGFGFIFQILAAKYLGAEIYGKANYYLGYCSTITIFICFGLQTYIPKIMSKEKDKKKVFSEVILTYTFLFFAVQLVIFIVLMLNRISIYNYILISLLAYFTVLAEIILSYNISTDNASKGMFYRKFLYSVLNLLLFSIVFMLSIKQYYVYIYIMIISYIITTIPFLFKNIIKCKINFNIIRVSFKFYIIQIIYGAYYSYSKVLQKEYGTFETVAVLSISMTIGSLVIMLGDNFAKISMPEFSKAWEKREMNKLKNIYMTVSRINCFLVLPIAIGLIVNAQRILSLLGKGYIGGEIIFSLVMVSQFANSFTGPNGTLLVMTKYTKLEIYNGIIKLLVSIIVIVSFGHKVIWAVPLSLVVAEIFVNLLKFIEVKITLDIVPYKIKDLLFIIIIATFQCFVLIYLSKISNVILWILINGVSVLVFYLLTFRLSPNREDKLIINDIKTKIMSFSK
ncbi:MAG: lipopolysaccharide biosynthesis protein [Clostridiaceae bacterium]